MENNNIITTVPAAEGKKQNAERNPLARFFSGAKSKCKKVITAVTTMVTMTMVSAVTAFAEGEAVAAELLTVKLPLIR